MKFRLPFTKKYQILLFVFILIIIFAYPLGLRIEIAKQQIVSNIPSALYSFYYQVINPSAGMIEAEKLYKRNFDAAEGARVDMNFTVDEMKQKARDPNSLYYYQEKIRGLMSDRETSYFEMIRIDKEQSSLDFSKIYKEFIIKRKSADENDYEAFKIYRDGMQKLMDANLAYYKFTTNYIDSYTDLKIIGSPDGFTPANIQHFEESLLALKVQFQEVDGLYKKGEYSEDIYQYMKAEHDSIDLFDKYTKALISGDMKQADQILTSIQKTREVKDLTESISLWVKEKAQPIFTAQDDKHRISLDLYKQAYTFARNQNLPVISVWPGGTPGEAPKKKIF